MPANVETPDKPENYEKAETIALRLAQILCKLNDGKKLDAKALASEFNVSERTIQRDLNERLVFLKLIKTSGLHQLPPASLGKLTRSDIDQFAVLAGIKGLFPELSDDFLSDIFRSRLQNPLLVKGPKYEDLAGKEGSFRDLERAIQQCRKVRYEYSKPEGIKTYAEIEPYKLVNHDGIWYLAGRDGGNLKSFAFTKISQLRILDANFKPDAATHKRLLDEDGIWLNEKKIELVLKISAEVASYFKRRKLVASQVTEKELEDGGLIISCKVAHLNQIVPTVRYWLPHIRIISPEGAQADMEKQMRAYLDAV